MLLGIILPLKLKPRQISTNPTWDINFGVGFVNIYVHDWMHWLSLTSLLSGTSVTSASGMNSLKNYRKDQIQMKKINKYIHWLMCENKICQ